MKKEVKTRESNFELMRIISMFMIVLWHVIIHGKMLDNSTGIIQLFLYFILTICIVHVNSFVMVTGYFQYEKDFSLKKFIKLFNMQWFYRAIITIIFTLIGFITLSKVDFLREVLPIGSFYNYWFLNCYLVLYLISPFLNKFIKACNQKELRHCLIISFILFSVVAYFTGNAAVNNSGSTILQFVFLYLLGAYLHKYPISNNYHFIRFSKEKKQVIFMFLTIFFCVINFFMLSFSILVKNLDSSIIKSFADFIYNGIYFYSNPFVIIQTIFYFLFFETLTVKSKIINKISGTTLGIYLIHDNSFVRNVIYKLLKIDNGNMIGLKMLIYMFIVMIIIFIICSFIEFIRDNISKWINDRKVIRNISCRFYNYISKI